MEKDRFVFVHKEITDKNGRPMYLNFNRESKEINIRRNLTNNDKYLVRLTLEQVLMINILIDADEWELFLERELGSKNLFNLKHKYIKSEDGKDLYLNRHNSNRYITINKSKVNNKIYHAEFTKSEIEELRKNYNLDGFEEVGVK